MFDCFFTFITNGGVSLWVVLGFFCLLIEGTAPIAVFLCLGLASFATAILTWLGNMTGYAQFALFSVLSIVMAWGGRCWMPKQNALYDKDHEADDMNNKASQMLNCVFVLSVDISYEPIQQKVNGLVWLVKGPSLPAGTRVKVVKIDGAALCVDSL